MIEDNGPTKVGDMIIELERRLSRAMHRGAGIFLKAEDLDVLAATGAADCLTKVRTDLLKERAKWRQKTASIDEATTTSTTTVALTASPAARGSTSIGIAQAKDASAARARASAMFS